MNRNFLRKNVAFLPGERKDDPLLVSAVPKQDDLCRRLRPRRTRDRAAKGCAQYRERRQELRCHSSFSRRLSTQAQIPTRSSRKFTRPAYDHRISLPRLFLKRKREPPARRPTAPRRRERRQRRRTSLFPRHRGLAPAATSRGRKNETPLFCAGDQAGVHTYVQRKEHGRFPRSRSTRVPLVPVPPSPKHSLLESLGTGSPLSLSLSKSSSVRSLPKRAAEEPRAPSAHIRSRLLP